MTVFFVYIVKGMVDRDVGGTVDRAAAPKDNKWTYFRLHCERFGMVYLAVGSTDKRAAYPEYDE